MMECWIKVQAKFGVRLEWIIAQSWIGLLLNVCHQCVISESSCYMWRWKIEIILSSSDHVNVNQEVDLHEITKVVKFSSLNNCAATRYCSESMEMFQGEQLWSTKGSNNTHRPVIPNLLTKERIIFCFFLENQNHAGWVVKIMSSSNHKEIISCQKDEFKMQKNVVISSFCSSSSCYSSL
jgi:hypothetical protein